MKNLKIFGVLILSILAIGSCTKDKIINESGFDFGIGFDLKFEELGLAEKEDLSIKVVDVLEDSRCPINALCVWEGQIKLELEINYNNTITKKEIINRQGKDLPLEFENFIFTLTSVGPYSQIDEEIEMNNYTFTFIVEKK